LGAFEPSVGSINLLGVGSERVISGHFLVHDTVQEQKHSSVINVWSVLKLLAVWNTAIWLDRSVYHELNDGMELLNVLSGLQKSQ
jgi:hypothetical protein